MDLNLYNVGGYDYISPNMNTSLRGSQNTGLKSFGGEAFRNRARLETLKYYNVTNPDLTNGLSSAGEKLYAGNVSAGLSEFGYFSPSQVFSGNRMPVDLLNSNSSNNAMAKVLESEISRKFREYKLGNIPVVSRHPRCHLGMRERQSQRAYRAPYIGSRALRGLERRWRSRWPRSNRL